MLSSLRKLLAINRGRTSAIWMGWEQLQILVDCSIEAAKIQPAPCLIKRSFCINVRNFLSILIEKTVKNTQRLVFLKKSKWLDNYWLNPDNLTVLWQALFQWVFCITQQPRRFCFDAVATHCMLLWLKSYRLSFNICIGPLRKLSKS